MPFKTSYGVSYSEVLEFVEGNPSVAGWAKRFVCGPRGGFSGSRLDKAQALCRFFKWLRLVKDITLSPEELLDRQIEMRGSSSVRDRQWLLGLVLEHTRDNPDFKDYCDMRKYAILNIIKGFCDFHEVPLTTAKNVYGRKRKKKNYRKQISLKETKELLGGINQRDRTIFLIMLQSGMEIGAVLNKFNYMWHTQIKLQLAMGCKRLKIDFDGRKGLDNRYFTYISTDAIHELKKWLKERERILETLLKEGKEVDRATMMGEPIFITKTGKPLREDRFASQISRKFKRRITSHMFRKLFKTEASIPERAVDRSVIEFFMGHINGIDAVGGEYDKTPELHEEIFEREYAKLEPYINIYSSTVAARRIDPLLLDIEKLSQLPGGRRFFRSMVEDAKVKLAEMLEMEKLAS